MTANNTLLIASAFAFILLVIAVLLFIELLQAKIKMNLLEQNTKDFTEEFKEQTNNRFTAIAKSLLDDNSQTPQTLLYTLFTKTAPSTFLLSNHPLADHWCNDRTFNIKSKGITYSYDEAITICEQLIRNKHQLKKI